MKEPTQLDFFLLPPPNEDLKDLMTRPMSNSFVVETYEPPPAFLIVI
jgi:hypothetical protein